MFADLYIISCRSFITDGALLNRALVGESVAHGEIEDQVESKDGDDENDRSEDLCDAFHRCISYHWDSRTANGCVCANKCRKRLVIGKSMAMTKIESECTIKRDVSNRYPFVRERESPKRRIQNIDRVTFNALRRVTNKYSNIKKTSLKTNMYERDGIHINRTSFLPFSP